MALASQPMDYCTFLSMTSISVFDSDGSELPSIAAASLGMRDVYWSAWSNAATPQLLLGGSDDLVAVDPSTLAVQWSVRNIDVCGIVCSPNAWGCCGCNE